MARRVCSPARPVPGPRGCGISPAPSGAREAELGFLRALALPSEPSEGAEGRSKGVITMTEPKFKEEMLSVLNLKNHSQLPSTHGVISFRRAAGERCLHGVVARFSAPDARSPWLFSYPAVRTVKPPPLSHLRPPPTSHLATVCALCVREVVSALFVSVLGFLVEAPSRGVCLTRCPRGPPRLLHAMNGPCFFRAE